MTSILLVVFACFWLESSWRRRLWQESHLYPWEDCCWLVSNWMSPMPCQHPQQYQPTTPYKFRLYRPWLPARKWGMRETNLGPVHSCLLEKAKTSVTAKAKHQSKTAEETLDFSAWSWWRSWSSGVFSIRFLLSEQRLSFIPHPMLGIVELS